MRPLVGLLVSCVCLLSATPLTSTERSDPGTYVNSFLVDADPEHIHAVAQDYGFIVEEKQHV